MLRNHQIRKTTLLQGTLKTFKYKTKNLHKLIIIGIVNLNRSTFYKRSNFVKDKHRTSKMGYDVPAIILNLMQMKEVYVPFCIS